MHVTGPYVYEGVSVYPYVDQSDPFRWLDAPDGKPDLIVTHLMNTLRASYLGQQYKISVATLMHNEHYKSRMDLRHQSRLVVYNTEWMRADVENWWRDSQESEPPEGIVVHPPIFPADYHTAPPTAAKGYVTLINLFEDKGASLFYQLAARFPRLRFLGVTGAYGKQDARKLPNVEIIPQVAAHDMKTQVYARTRILLMPSVYESYGRAGVEAACSGIPTIAHPTPGLLEALGPGGTFADREDISAWAAELARLTTPRGWTEASARARAVAGGLTADADLDRWATAAEAAARVPLHV
jgi:glycosyltransferase involved in cell wall biosynthesis